MYKKLSTVVIISAVLTLLTACTPPPTPASSSSTLILSPTTTPTFTFTPTLPDDTTGTPAITCELPPVVVPTLPAEIPGYTDLDPSTNLHMTGTYLQLDLKSYSLEVTGKVSKPLNLSYDELRCLPKIEKTSDLVCPGYFIDHATWTGASLDTILDMAGVQENASNLKLYSADGYYSNITITEARTGENFLAYEWEGQPLPILHGFPVRAVFPDQQGNKWVKWLVKIVVE
jgi:DMSO/TMAO reductase YedYZ molybdopterin-dependent catalytic subunit